jgi:hypothetical protein
MCADRAGEEAFTKYMKDLISPRVWGLDTAQDIAVRLRGADNLKGFPMSDIIIVLNGCVGARLAKGHTGTKITESQLGARLRAAGCHLYYPTRHLDGTYSASGSARDNPGVVVLSKAIALMRTAADHLDTLDPAEVGPSLTPEMRQQLTMFADAQFSRLDRAYKILKENG